MPIPDSYTIEEMRRRGVKDVFALIVARVNERIAKNEAAERGEEEAEESAPYDRRDTAEGQHSDLLDRNWRGR